MPFIPPPVSSILPWFPRHQKNTLRLLKDGVHHIDLVLEVRDARIPLSSENPQFAALLGRRDRIVVFNKKELSNQNMNRLLATGFAKHHPTDPFVFTTCKTRDGSMHSSLKKIMQLLVQKVERDPHRLNGMNIVVVGLPNVGKRKVSQVAPFAGVTRAIQTKVKIHDNPTIYLVDTPGVLNPEIQSPIQGLRIALAGCTKDALSDQIAICEYLLFRLNQSEKCVDAYCKGFGLDRATENVAEVLDAIMRKSKEDGRDREPDEFKVRQSSNPVEAANAFLALFREGAFGPMTLDDCSEEGMEEWKQGVKNVSGQREGARGKILYVE
ncbi:Mitochondrial GTPase [Podochytrium sp. JEL0797]|nr:Mitochondrial GTPase [Podochytrium sp. JEL0797]